jgi:hypothetical protein
VNLAFSPSPELKGKIFVVLFLQQKLTRAPDCSKNSKCGAAESPDWDSFHLQHFSAQDAFG